MPWLERAASDGPVTSAWSPPRGQPTAAAGIHRVGERRVCPNSTALTVTTCEAKVPADKDYPEQLLGIPRVLRIDIVTEDPPRAAW